MAAAPLAAPTRSWSWCAPSQAPTALRRTRTAIRAPPSPQPAALFHRPAAGRHRGSAPSVSRHQRVRTTARQAAPLLSFRCLLPFARPHVVRPHHHHRCAAGEIPHYLVVQRTRPRRPYAPAPPSAVPLPPSSAPPWRPIRPPAPCPQRLLGHPPPPVRPMSVPYPPHDVRAISTP